MERNTDDHTTKRSSPFSKEYVVEKKKTKQDENELVLQNTEHETPQKIQDRTINIELPKDITYYESSEYTAIKELFLVEMPIDFFKFYEILNADGAIVKTLASVNLELIGPYDLLLGKLPKVDSKELYLSHWKFFYDPPEFQAVLKKKGNSEYHIGYFRDAPHEMPVLLGSNDSAKNCRITIMADNIFGAVYQYLQNEKRNINPFSITCQMLMDKIKKYAEDNNFSIDLFDLKKRKALQITNTLHHAGIVMPDIEMLSYKELLKLHGEENIEDLYADLRSDTIKERKDIILSKLETVISTVSRELHFVTALELGMDLFCSGVKELESYALNILKLAYSSLNRQEFNRIVTAHMNYRRRGPHMSLFE